MCGHSPFRGKDTVDFPIPPSLGTAIRPSHIDMDPWSWSPLPTLGGSGYYVKVVNKTRITGLRLAPPRRDVGAFNSERREAKETNNPGKPSEPTRRAFAEHTYRDNRKHSPRVRVPSAERDQARALRMKEREARELREHTLLRNLRTPATKETLPEHLRQVPPCETSSPSGLKREEKPPTPEPANPEEKTPDP